jgi:hypothetical protein|nr:MAG TPA: Protein of unknown function (DUF3102) [Caudoviricetes sp.]
MPMTSTEKGPPVLTPRTSQEVMVLTIPITPKNNILWRNLQVDFTISRRLSSGRLYAYYKKRFWFWDDTRNVWTESHLMSQKYEREHSARAALTPEDFMSDLTRFSPLDEYELDSVMVDALKNAIPCKTVPIEPVKEESECPVSIPETSPQSSESAPSEASANVSSVLTSAPPMNCTPDVSIGIPSGMNPPDKPLTFIPENKTPEFDYSGLDKQTVEDLHFAEDEYRHGKKLAERGLVHMGNAIAAAHDALCDTVVQQLDNGQFAKKEDTFRAWCCSIGITKSTAYNLLQVSALMDGSSPRQRAILEALPPTLLYAVAKPSAPAELVEKVKNGEVSTNKEYQDLLAQIKAEKERADTAEAERDKLLGAQNRAAWAESHIQDVEAQRDAALADVQGLNEVNARLNAEKEKAVRSYNEMYESRIAANLQRQKAEAERDRAEERAKNAEDALKKQPITAVIDEEEIDRRAAEKACGLADARNAELAKDNANLKKQVAALRSRINDDAQADFEQANYCASLMQAAWDNSKASYSRLAGEDLESTFQTICGTLNSIMEEASLLCRQPSDHDGGDRDE